MPDVSLPWGHGQLSFALPENWTIQQTAAPSLKPAAADWPERLAESLRQPVAGPPLGQVLSVHRQGRVVLVVEDLTRHSPLPQILPVILRETRHAGITDDQMSILLATGMHPPMTPEQQAAKLGPETEGISRRCNPWHDRTGYVSLGWVQRVPIELEHSVAQADVRIIVSSVSPHLQAGFGGGYKMLFPGCASLETIRGLHGLGVERRLRQLVGTEAAANPMRCAVDAAGALLEAAGRCSFAVQYLLDETNQPVAMACGEVLPSQRMIAKQCAVSCGILLSGPADVLIVNAHPLDTDLWQSFKCIANTRHAVRPGGMILCLSRCESRMQGMRVPRWPLSPAWTRRLLRLLGPEALSGLAKRALPYLAGEAWFFVRLAAQTLRRNTVLLVSPAMHAAGARFPGLPVLASPEEAVAAARRVLGEGPQRAIVFPCGGTTYPIPEGSPGRLAGGGESP